MPTIYSGGRQNGKTTLLIMQSAQTGAVIVAPTRAMAQHVYYLAREMELKIPKPITVYELLINTMYRDKKHYLIDELQAILQQLNVDGATINELDISEIPPIKDETGGTRMNEKVLKHKEICDGLNELYARKNHDYGDSFHQTFEEEGLAMARIRLWDKFSRFKTLSRLSASDSDTQKVTDESIEDTLLDMANYAIMTVLEMRCEKEARNAKRCKDGGI